MTYVIKAVNDGAYSSRRAEKHVDDAWGICTSLSPTSPARVGATLLRYVRRFVPCLVNVFAPLCNKASAFVALAVHSLLFICLLLHLEAIERRHAKWLCRSHQQCLRKLLENNDNVPHSLRWRKLADVTQALPAFVTQYVQQKNDHSHCLRLIVL